MNLEKLIVGCCGWSYFSPKNYFGEEWNKRFVSRLQCYASMFNAVEINSTFYKIPNEKTAVKWLDEVKEVNKEFVFTLKVNKIVSHVDVFKTRSSEEAFLKSLKIARILKTKFLLIQTPQSFKPTDSNINNLKNFLKSVSKRLNYERIVFEFRGDFLKNEKIIRKICEENKLEHCVDVFRNKPVVCNEFLYFRLHGFGKKIIYDYNFNDDELKLLKKKVFDLERNFKPKKIFIFFNNYYMYENALKFIKLIEQ
jgi:uncharacterized protein YecE (DUF72 family)